jgi:hypothetical protein
VAVQPGSSGAGVTHDREVCKSPDDKECAEEQAKQHYPNAGSGRDANWHCGKGKNSIDREAQQPVKGVPGFTGSARPPLILQPKLTKAGPCP